MERTSSEKEKSLAHSFLFLPSLRRRRLKRKRKDARPSPFFLLLPFANRRRRREEAEARKFRCHNKKALCYGGGGGGWDTVARLERGPWEGRGIKKEGGGATLEWRRRGTVNGGKGV